jgi:hypothetical protein
MTSLLRASRDPIHLIVHDDGSLTNLSVGRLKERFPSIVVVSRRDADEQLGDVLSKFPTIATMRRSLPHVLKLVDVNLIGCEPVTRFVDPDVLFFRRFEGLFPMHEPGVDSGAFSLDSNSSFGAKISDFWPLGPLTLVRRLNSGVFWIKREIIDFERMEWLFRRWGEDRISRYGGWFEQLVWADLAWRENARVFDENLVRTATASTGTPTGREVAIHYVTPARAALHSQISSKHIGREFDDKTARVATNRARRYGICQAVATAFQFRLCRRSGR